MTTIPYKFSAKRISAKVKEMRENGHYASYTNKERNKIAVLVLRVETLKRRTGYRTPEVEMWDRAEVAAIEWALSRISPGERVEQAA